MPCYMSTAAAAVGATLLVAHQLPTANAYAKYAMQLPNGNDVPGAPNIGHVDAAGLQGTNDFGKAWTKFKGWTVAYCQADSDGDGFTNGQELGDPCCTWTPANPGSLITDGISHPSDKTKTPTNPKLQVKCDASAGGAAAGGAAAGGAAAGGAAAAPAAGGGDAAAPGTVHGAPADEDEDMEAHTLKPMSSAPRHTMTTAATAVAALVVGLLW